MKRYKRLGILLGLLVVACAATFALSRVEERKERIQNTDEIILEIPADSVTALSWSCGDREFSFHRDGIWLYDGDAAFPVDGEKIGKILSHFEALGAAFIIEEVDDYGQYGLDTPVCTIHITGSEQAWDIRLGDFSKMDSQRYVDMGDGSVYLVKEDPYADCDVTLSDLIDHDRIPSFENVTQLTFQGAEDYSIRYTEEGGGSYSEDDVYFTQDGRPLDTSLVESYLNNVSGTRLTDYVTYNATAEELAQFGMDDPELTVTVSCTREAEGDDTDAEPEDFVLHISRSPEEAGESQGSEETETAAYVRVGQSKIVYQISQDEYKLLMEASYNDLRHQKVFWADLDDVTRIDITLEDQEHTLLRETDADGEPVWRFPKAEESGETATESTGETAAEDDTVEIGSLQNAIKILTAEEFTDQAPTQKEEIRLTIHLDDPAYPETELAFYRYNGSQCLAVVDGGSVCLVKRSTVMNLVEAVQTIVLD